MNCEMFSVGDLLEETIGLPGFPGLWIFGSAVFTCQSLYYDTCD